MRWLFTIILFFAGLVAIAQPGKERLETAIKEFHQALVQKNIVAVAGYTDEALSYGHSNGWVETKMDMLGNLETGYISYHEFKEDSLSVVINGDVAHARFVADIKVTLNGKEGNYYLKVLEVWVRRGERWLLFARQAVKG